MDGSHDPVVEFGAFYRALTAPLVALLLARGAGPLEAVCLAQDTMAAARARVAADGAPAAESGHRDRARELRAWTHRVALGGLERRTAPVPADAVGPAAPLLPSGARALPVCGAWETVAERLAALGPRPRRVIALTAVSYAPGGIGYELLLPASKVHRTLRSVGRLLGEPTEDALTARLTATLDELAAVLAGALDLEAGLAGLDAGGEGERGPYAGFARAFPGAWAVDPRLPVPPGAAPVPPAPALGPGHGPGAPLRGYAAELAGRDEGHRARVRAYVPRAELAAARLGALFAFHTDRFRKDAEASWYRDSGVDFPAADARAYAAALARDVSRASAVFEAVCGPAGDAPRRADNLASWLERDEPSSVEVSYEGIELSLALGRLRASALSRALRAAYTVSASGALADGGLHRALAPAETAARGAIGRLRALGADLSRAESTLPDGYYVDMTRDFAADEALNRDLIHGVEELERALADGPLTG
ncbi:hypothetical protein ABT084_27655 [Streptomyces sp. NPDC002138]|uniref:hypothetical protein n=1 Tax=Streptomyces sp. NPDC002138 TaxID=3154410 RepID=UPI00331BD5C1